MSEATRTRQRVRVDGVIRLQAQSTRLLVVDPHNAYAARTVAEALAIRERLAESLGLDVPATLRVSDRLSNPPARRARETARSPIPVCF